MIKNHIDFMTYCITSGILLLLGGCLIWKREDMMVYIHATEKAFDMIGHIDFSIDHKVYSYRNYDHESVQMMEALGDGVMLIADEEPYLPFGILHEENTIFAFGLKLQKIQKQRVYAAIQETMKDTIP